MHPGAGAICTFSGTVRDNSRGEAVTHLEYEAYAEMAVPQMKKIGQEIKDRWPEARVAMAHRTGHLEISEVSVVVSVPGFKTLNRAGLQVAAGQTLPLDLVLEVGSVTDSVTVTADADAQAGKPDPNGIPASRETYAEVAHEAIFRRWDRLREWIAAEREFLAWKTGLEGARRAWKATPDNSKQDALLMGLALSQARSWRGKRSEDIAAIDREFIDQSSARESRAKTRARRVQALVYMLLVGIILVLIGVMNETYIKEQVTWHRTIRPYRVANVDPYVLTPAAERALKPGDTFRECANDCPEMDVTWRMPGSWKQSSLICFSTTSVRSWEAESGSCTLMSR